jgi:hypothetical protein
MAMWASKKATESAAKFVDGKIQGLAGTIDVISSGLKNVGTEGEGVNRFAAPATEKMDTLANKLRENNGEQIVEAAKQQMLAHPRATVTIAAVAGALVAQAAIASFRAEQASNDTSGDNSVDIDVDSEPKQSGKKQKAQEPELLEA